MNFAIDQKHALLYRTILGLAMVALAAALRVAPHPWNFTPIGAMALFSGAIFKDRRLAFAFPLLALFAGDIFTGLYKIQLMLVVYSSLLASVAIGLWLREHRSVVRIGLATLLGSLQFFLVTNFAFWVTGLSYPHTRARLIACYVAGLPFFWNTLAGDAFYAVLLFGGFALAERTFPALREHGALESSL